MKNTLLIFATLFQLSNANAQIQLIAGHESGGRPGASAVYIVFASMGSGVDRLSLQHVETYIQDPRHKTEVLEINKKPWGREGETTYCINLKKAYDRLQFIQFLAPTIVKDRINLGAKRTTVLVGLNCSNQDSATEQDLIRYLTK